jgi:hypothetical protein
MIRDLAFSECAIVLLRQFLLPVKQFDKDGQEVEPYLYLRAIVRNAISRVLKDEWKNGKRFSPTGDDPLEFNGRTSSYRHGKNVGVDICFSDVDPQLDHDGIRQFATRGKSLERPVNNPEISWEEFIWAACGDEIEIALFGIKLYEGRQKQIKTGWEAAASHRLEQHIKRYQSETEIDFCRLLNNRSVTEQVAEQPMPRRKSKNIIFEILTGAAR